jgi:hypothetical protein
MTLPRFVLWQARDAEEDRGNQGEDGGRAARPVGEDEGGEMTETIRTNR